MSHDLEVKDGIATFVAVKEHGWHGLGTLVEHDLTVSEGLSLANLADLEYQVRPLAVPVGTPRRFIVAGNYKAVVRRNPFDREQWDVLGAGMTDAYTLHTPEQAFGFGEDIIESGKPLAAMGSIKGGRRAFAAFRLDDLTIGGVDQIKTFLNILTSFDGSMATYARVSTIRTVCSNTFHYVLSESSAPTYVVRHVGEGLEGRVDDARAALQVGWKALEQFQAEVETLIDREVTDKEFTAITEALFPITDKTTERGTAIAQESRSAVTALYNGPTVAPIRGTAWGALNAYTEWLDWTGGNYGSPEARMVAQITPGSAIDAKRVGGAKKITNLLKIKTPATV